MPRRLSPLDNLLARVGDALVVDLVGGADHLLVVAFGEHLIG